MKLQVHVALKPCSRQDQRSETSKFLQALQTPIRDAGESEVQRLQVRQVLQPCDACDRSFREVLTVFRGQRRHLADGTDGKPVLPATVDKVFFKGDALVQKNILDDVVIIAGRKSVQCNNSGFLPRVCRKVCRTLNHSSARADNNRSAIGVFLAPNYR